MPVLVEVGWGGLVQYPWSITWTDISDRVDLVQGVTITRGASDELSETQPGSCTMTLDNEDGALTPGNPASPFYPFVRRNAPIRVSVAVIPTRTGVGPWPLAQLGDDFDDGRIDPGLWPSSYGGVSEIGGRARIPCNPGTYAAYQSARVWRLVGSRLTARLATVPVAGGSTEALASMMINSTTAGTRIGWTYNAVTGTLRAVSETAYYDPSATAETYSPIDHLWLRIREAGGLVYWETSGDGAEWTVRRTLPTPAWVTAQQVLVELVASRTGGVGDFAEWDLLGAVIRPRFYGSVNEWPVAWEGLLSSVSISATDLFKRLNRLPPLRSMLSEEISLLNPAAYYPLTEPAGSASVGDLSGSGAAALAVIQAGTGGTLTMAAGEGPAETGEQAPAFAPASASAGQYLGADLGPVASQAIGIGVTIEAWIKTTVTGRAFVGLYAADLQTQVMLSVSAGGGLAVEWTGVGGALTVTPVAGTSGLADGQWHHVVYDQGAYSVWVDGVLVSSAVNLYALWDLRFMEVGGYRGARLWDGSIAHVAVYSVASSPGGAAAYHWEAGATGYAGEAADVRVQRLVRYAGIGSVTTWGTTHDPMASQGPGGSGVVARLREVEATESARLFAERDYFGLAYQSRDVRYNPDANAEAFTIDYADLDTTRVQLSDDDQKLTNEVTASRPDGATQIARADSSVLAFGVYGQSLTLLKTSDNSVLDAAYWVVSRYADPGPELREVPVEAYTMPQYLDILDADISSYFTVHDLPDEAPATEMRCTVEGYTETIKHRSHTIQFRTSASVRDSVWVLDDPVYSVLDTTTRLAY